MKNSTKQLIIFAMLAYLANATNAFSASFPLTLSDDDGAQVIIKKEPQRIAVAGLWPLPSVIMMLEGSAQKIVYMPKASKNALLHSFMIELYPQIAQIPAGNSENIEELLSLKPDVFICHSANKAICATMRKSGVPTIAVSVAKWQYDSRKTLEGWFRLIAPLLNKEAKAEQILREIIKQEGLNAHAQNPQNLSQQNPNTQNPESRANNLRQATKSADKNALPKAIFIHTYASDEKLTIAGIFGKYLLDSSGGSNALDSLRSANASIEEIYKLNPDIIYINNFTPIVPKEILESKRWQGIKAVQHKRVYKLPLGSYRPFAPGVDLPVLLSWLRAHNAEFIESRGGQKSAKIEDYKAYTKWYYKEIFGLTLSEVQIEKIFNPSSKAGNLQ